MSQEFDSHAKRRLRNIVSLQEHLLREMNDLLDSLHPEKKPVRLRQVKQAYLTKLEDLGLSTRIYTSLRREGISTTAQLVQLEPADLALFRNMGPKSVREIQEKLAAKSLTLRPYNPARLQPELRRIFRLAGIK